MLNINKIRDNKQAYIDLLKLKDIDPTELFDSVIALDDERKITQQKADKVLANANHLASQIGELYKSGEEQKANILKEETILIKEKSKKLQQKKLELQQQIKDILLQIPNVPHYSVPVGKSDADNIIIKESGEIPVLQADAKPHWQLAADYNLIDFALGNKITGSGFPVYINKGAKLQRALISYFLDKNIEAGYIEYLPPHLVNETSAFGTGNLPDKDGQMYYVAEDNLYLIPTAEIPVTNLFRDMIIKDFPVKCTAYTPCFRREAGSYGKDVRGLNRLHQFDKVEIVQIVSPEKSYTVLNDMCNYVESLLENLKLPYRKIKLCSGDLGFTSAMTYDFEVFSPGQKKWLECSSVSNFETYQSNRANIKIKLENKSKVLAHTLNGSALALPRILASIIENNQSNNKIKVPKVLIPYTGFDEI